MIQHNSLAERLNAVKGGKPIPTPPAIDNITIPIKTDKSAELNTPVSIKDFLVIESYKLFGVLAASTLYGAGLKAIFNTNWNFIGMIGVGLLLNHFLSFVLKLFRK